MSKSKRYAPEVSERAVRIVFEHQKEYHSQWEAISMMAPKFGCTPQTLCNWVRQTERDQGLRDGTTSSERDELKTLRREVKQLKKANEILRKASAYFAQAELDR